MAWAKLGSTKLENGTEETVTESGMTGDNNANTTYLVYKQIAGLTAGHAVTKISFDAYSFTSTSFKVGVYSDNSNQPGTLLASATKASSSLSNTYTTITVPLDSAATIDSSGKVWVAVVMDTTSVNLRVNTGSGAYTDSVYATDSTPSGRSTNYASMLYSTANITGNGGNNVRFGVVTVTGGAADVITVDSLTAKKHLMVQVKGIGTGGTINCNLTFNSDTGNNYAIRENVNGGSDSTNVSQANTDNLTGTVTGNVFANINIINEASKEKLFISHGMENTAGAGNAPDRKEIVGKWTNTSNAITVIKANNGGTGSFAEGSEVTVYGTD